MTPEQYNQTIRKACDAVHENQLHLKQISEQYGDVLRLLGASDVNEDEQVHATQSRWALTVLAQIKNQEAELEGFKIKLKAFYKLLQTTQETETVPA